MSITKIIIFLVGVLVLIMVVGKVREASGNPFEIGNQIYSCNGQECTYSVEVKNTSLQSREGTLSVETYSITEMNNNQMNKRLEFRVAVPFQVDASQVKTIHGKYDSDTQPNKWLFEAFVAE